MVVHEKIEQELEKQAGIFAVAEEDGDAITLSGLIQSEEERQTAFEIATAMAPDKTIVDNLEVTTVLPEEIGDVSVAGAALAGQPMAEEGVEDNEALEPGDFTDQRTTQDAFTADGPSGTAADEEISEGEESYAPPIDPVRDRDGEFLGGFALSSMESLDVERSVSDGRLGDEAIAESVRRELREDSSTAELDIEVEVEGGIVHLRGKVQDLTDAESAEDVASRLPGVIEVREELTVTNI